MQGNKELISVIVPVYKAERSLDKCVRSILSQTYRNLEVILVDDGSPDRSGELCDGFAKEDARVRVIHQENGGVSSARNVGLDAMLGQYFCFVDSDDYAEPEMIQKLYDAIICNEAELAICGYKNILEGDVTDQRALPVTVSGKEEIAHYVLHYYLKAWISSPWGKLYRNKKSFDMAFDKNISLGEDEKFNIQYFERTNKIVAIPDCLYCYVDSVGSLTNTYRTGYYEGICSLYATTVAYMERVFGSIDLVDLSNVNYKLVACCGVFMARNIAMATPEEQRSFIKQICNNPLVRQAIRNLPPVPISYRVFIWALKSKNILVLSILSRVKRCVDANKLGKKRRESQ